MRISLNRPAQKKRNDNEEREKADSEIGNGGRIEWVSEPNTERIACAIKGITTNSHWHYLAKVLYREKSMRIFVVYNKKKMAVLTPETALRLRPYSIFQGILQISCNFPNKIFEIKKKKKEKNTAFNQRVQVFSKQTWRNEHCAFFLCI